MSFRLSLDVCVRNPQSLHLARRAVNSFMTIVLSVDKNTGILDTMTPSEPVLAVAAMTHLCTGSNWPLSIETLIAALLKRGLIEKGHGGELYSRVVLTLAHDSVQRNWEGGWPRLMPTFTVHDFLRALYAEDHHESINALAPAVLAARMNFTHFVPAGEWLTSGVVSELCHDLLRRKAAMQLAPTQPTYDQLLPIYFGKESELFDPSKCGAILVQYRNKETATTPEEVFQEEFVSISPEPGRQSKWEGAKPIRDTPYFAFDQMVKPILFLLFDFATALTASNPLIQVSRSGGEATPHVWVIHLPGHTENTFGCLKAMGVGSLSAALFAATKPQDCDGC